MSTDVPRIPQSAGQGETINGVVVAMVRDNRDPNGLSRVRVSFPWHKQPEELHWARLATPMTGKGYGTFFLPEVGDEVLVAFERGDLRFPFIVGSLWGRDRTPPATNADGRNDIRIIRSRKGHTLSFDDGKTDRLQLALHDGKAITIDEGGITIDDAHGNRILISTTSGVTTIDAASALRIRAPKISVESSGALDIKAGGTLTLQGSLVAIN